ncbi:MAG: hypothetical protein HY001_01285 [Candidatus Portnoybacteria bacterium]|nr:hypothetical protein [Candidatus Portnoybacteria bacterium]
MNYQRGITTVEVIIILAITSIALLALNEVMGLSLEASSQGLLREKALLLAKEGMEVIGIMRNQGWASSIAPLSTGVNYYPTFSGNVWSLGTTSPGLIDNLYARRIVFEAAARDGASNIAPSGPLDPDTKKVTITVTWQSQGSKMLGITTYMTNLLQN